MCAGRGREDLDDREHLLEFFPTISKGLKIYLNPYRGVGLRRTWSNPRYTSPHTRCMCSEWTRRYDWWPGISFSFPLILEAAATAVVLVPQLLLHNISLLIYLLSFLLTRLEKNRKSRLFAGDPRKLVSASKLKLTLARPCFACHRDLSTVDALTVARKSGSRPIIRSGRSATLGPRCCEVDH